MEQDFWHSCWEKNHIGFHQDEFHPLLITFFESWIDKCEGSVFVPLCGKSLDMHYIAEHRPVLGSELSEIACRDFFEQSASTDYKVTPQDVFTRYSSGNVTLLAGDFFSLQSPDVAQCSMIYDRAALIALPQDMQNKYVEQLRALFPCGTRMLLIGLEYPEGALPGPPFSTDETRVRQLFDGCTVERAATLEIEDGKFARRQFDVPWMREVVYFITF